MKVPKKAKRVFKGEIHDVYQWPQKMYDGSMHTFEMIKRQGTVIVFATVDNKIIVQKQKQPDTKDWYYCMPAGRMDKKGESPKNAALRELLEETGYKPKAIKLWQHLNPNRKMDHDIYLFIARDCKKVAEPNLDAGEKIINRFYSFDRFLKHWDDPDFIDGETKKYLFMAKFDKKYRAKLKKTIFG